VARWINEKSASGCFYALRCGLYCLHLGFCDVRQSPNILAVHTTGKADHCQPGALSDSGPHARFHDRPVADGIRTIVTGVAIAIFIWVTQCTQWNWSKQRPVILLISMATAYYAYPYDQVLVMPVRLLIARLRTGLRILSILFHRRNVRLWPGFPTLDLYVQLVDSKCLALHLRVRHIR
jgi:hypothetical protein